MEKSDMASQLPRALELTLFAPDATRVDIEKLCAEAHAKQFHGVCVNGSQVELARALLDESESNVQVVALVDFPLGSADADAKRYAVEIAVDQGAHEVDYVINLGRLKQGDRPFVLREMRDIVEAADERPVKAIIESHLLTRDEKILVCQLALDSGVQFVATATDFHSPPVTAEDVKLLNQALGGQVAVKAAGGIRDLKTASELIEAGAKRIGILSGLALK
jgi:deoxyribose-phosphate aldolase